MRLALLGFFSILERELFSITVVYLTIIVHTFIHNYRQEGFMMRRATTLLAVCALVITMAHAGGRRDMKTVRPAPLVFDSGIERQAVPVQGSYVSGLDNATSLSWVLVDTMANAFGPASNQVFPLQFDPGTGALVVIHRGAAPYSLRGGNALWYNVSLDGGAGWHRVGDITAGETESLRYPNVDIRNPRGSSDTSIVWVPYAAPNLRNTGGTFGGLTYGVDIFGTNQAFSQFDDGPGNDFSYPSNFAIWSATNTGGSDSTIFWATRRGGTANEFYLWRTSDYASIAQGTPPTWAAANFTNPFSYINGRYRNGKTYLNVISLIVGDTTTDENYGYSVSANNGATWSGWTRPQPGWHEATGVPYSPSLLNFYRGTGNFASFEVEAEIDANERGHFFSVVADSPWTLQDRRSIIEVFQTATGWDHKYVTQSMNQNTGLMYPGVAGDADALDQTYNAIKPSMSPDGQVMTLVWLDAAAPASSDTTPDIWFSWRRIDGASWSTPENLTQTPGFSEMLLHAAPVLRNNGSNSYTLFLGRSYQTGINTYPPNNGALTSFFVSSYTFTANPSSVGGPNEQPSSFKLEQNYPNPFNPTTNIRYSVATGGLVSLKVYNTLGQELATLVNGNVAPGEHTATFDATRFSSGVYIYKLTSGNSVETRKMLLLK